MPDPACRDPRCIHRPGFVIGCGYDLALGLASVGPGWAPLVHEGFAAVAGRGRVVQVKQKWGELRVYADLDVASSAIEDRLLRLSEESRVLCQVCGGPRTPGDGRGRCPSCA